MKTSEGKPVGREPTVWITVFSPTDTLEPILFGKFKNIYKIWFMSPRRTAPYLLVNEFLLPNR